jgi:gluconate 2-dehydrogenase gamma chain
MAVAAAASTFSGFSKWNFAHAQSMDHDEHARAAQVQVRTAYTPQFFSPFEYATVVLLTDLILPATTIPAPSQTEIGTPKRHPGAKELGVAEFIDFIVFNDRSLQQSFRSGLQWLDRAAKPAHSFTDLSAAQQHALLDRLAYKKEHRPDEKAGQQFFALVRRYTVMGFYTTREGLEFLDFPGLTFYATSPGCTHGENAEHAGL